MHPASHSSLTNIITHTNEKHESTKKIKYYNRYKSSTFLDGAIRECVVHLFMQSILFDLLTVKYFQLNHKRTEN
jgi:hypothetical protein